MTRLMRRAGAWLLQPCLLLAWMCVVTGCNAATTQGNGNVPATVLPTISTVTLNTTPLDYNNAWGNVKIRQIPATVDANYLLNFSSANTPDGHHVLVDIEPSSFLNSQQLPSFVGVYDLSTDNLTRIRRMPSVTGQILTAAADNRYMVWLETVDQNEANWTMWLYDLQTQRIQQIGQNSKNAQGQPVSGTYPTPWVSNGHLIWGQRIGEIARPDVSNDVIKLMDLTTGQMQTIATSAGLPALDWPWLSYVQSDNKGNVNGVIKNLETSQTVQWQDGGLPYLQSMTLKGHSIAYSLLNGDPSSVKYIGDFTQNTTPMTLISGHDGTNYVDFVTMNDRLIGWGAASTNPTLVWDRKLARFVLLPSGSQVGTTVFSTLVFWPTLTVSADRAKQLKGQGIIPPYAYNVIDTTTLP